MSFTKVGWEGGVAGASVRVKDAGLSHACRHRGKESKDMS